MHSLSCPLVIYPHVVIELISIVFVWKNKISSSWALPFPQNTIYSSSFPLSLLLLLWTIVLLNINLNRHLPHISAQCNSRIYSSSSAVGCYRIPKIIIIIVPHLSHQLLLHLNEWMITRMRIWSCSVCVAENTVSELMHRLPTSPNVITRRRRRLCVDGRPSLLVIHAVDCHSPDHHPPLPSPSCSLTQLRRTLSLPLPLRLFS